MIPSKLYPLLLLLLSTCYLKQYPVTPQVVRPSVFTVHTAEAQGTAWAVDPYHLVTAGHVCETAGETYVIANDYRRFRAWPVYWEKGGEGLYDGCVLETKFKLDYPLLIAKSMPNVGDKIWYTGFPLGEFYEGSGRFLGDLDGKEEENNAAFSAICGSGASGSPVYTEQGVWGILVRLRTDGGRVHPGEDGCVAVALPQLVRLLRIAGVKYFTPPDLPPEIDTNPEPHLPPNWDKM